MASYFNWLSDWDISFFFHFQKKVETEKGSIGATEEPKKNNTWGNGYGNLKKKTYEKFEPDLITGPTIFSSTCFLNLRHF